MASAVLRVLKNVNHFRDSVIEDVSSSIRSCDSKCELKQIWKIIQLIFLIKYFVYENSYTLAHFTSSHRYSSFGNKAINTYKIME